MLTIPSPHVTRAAALPLLAALLTACTAPTAPTAQKLDAYHRYFKQQAQPQYAELEAQRASGEISQWEYERRKESLDRHVLQQADTKALSEHMLAQSELKAQGIPTPDRPVANPPPVGGAVQDTLYRPAAQQFGQTAGVGVDYNQNSILRGRGGFQEQGRMAGTIYDPPPQ